VRCFSVSARVVAAPATVNCCAATVVHWPPTPRCCSATFMVSESAPGESQRYRPSPSIADPAVLFAGGSAMIVQYTGWLPCPLALVSVVPGSQPASSTPASTAAEAYTTSLRTFAPPFVVPGAIVPLDAAVGSAP